MIKITLFSAVLVFLFGCASNSYYQPISPQIETAPSQRDSWKSSRYNKLKDQEEIVITLPVYSTGYKTGEFKMHVNLIGDKSDILFCQISQSTIAGSFEKSWNVFRKIQIGGKVYEKNARINFGSGKSKYQGQGIYLEWDESERKAILNELCSNVFDGDIKLIGEYDDVIIKIDMTHFDYVRELNSKYNPQP